MTDVDAIRFLASEHDLEFVDLEQYSVDPTVADILPEAVARRHQAVVVKRKFGTPVVAIADPDDVFALDTLRASIGRDFISVVAAADQITSCLDAQYGGTGAASDGAPPPTLDARVLDPGTDLLAGALTDDLLDSANGSGPDPGAAFIDLLAGGDGPAPQGAVPVVPAVLDGEDDEDDEDLDDTLGLSLYGSAFMATAQSTDEETGDLEDPVTPASGAGEPSPGVPEPEPGSVLDGPAGDGVGQPTTDQPWAAGAPDVTGSGSGAWQDMMSTPMVAGPSSGDGPSEPGSAPGESSLDDSPGAADLGGLAPTLGQSVQGEWPTAWPDEAIPVAEPASSDPAAPTPVIGYEPIISGLSDSSDALAASAGELSEFAESTGAKPSTPGVDSPEDEVVLTADLVDEAVATFEEAHAEFDTSADDEAASGPMSQFPPLAKALVEGDRVPLDEMESVVDEYRQTGQSVARILTARKLVTEADLMWGMAQEMGLEFVDLDVAGVNFADAGTIPESTARHHNILVIGNDDGTPIVAASNPTDVFAMDDLRTIIGRAFITVVATRSQISTYIGRAFNSGGDAADMAMEASLGFDGSSPDSGVEDIQVVTEDAPIVRYVNLLILQALNERASDIHVEPTASELRIRYRIDGVLHDVSTAPRSIAAAVTTRLKVMADMNIAEHRIPQDGRISLNVGSSGVDLRMATLPTIHGEKVVMRVLDKSSVVLGFGDLGFDDDLLVTYEGIFTKPYGTILVTGPTGSGKSTTLYTTLTALNSPEKNIITVEDPVELQIKGINQVQLNIKAGLTFASALRSILRSDPDIVLVGEIRDKETAVIAIEAALTGHMVLATLHTNSAASTPMRLIEMGLEPFLVTSSLSGVLAQRLARRLCSHCKDPYEPTEADIVAAGWSLEEVEKAGGIPKVYRAIGCSACSNTGYRGRKALAELMPMTEEIERTIIEGGSVDEIHRLAISQGMGTLRQSGLRKALEGETTLEEVLRVVA